MMYNYKQTLNLLIDTNNYIVLTPAMLRTALINCFKFILLFIINSEQCANMVNENLCNILG